MHGVPTKTYLPGRSITCFRAAQLDTGAYFEARELKSDSLSVAMKDCATSGFMPSVLATIPPSANPFSMRCRIIPVIKPPDDPPTRISSSLEWII